MVFRKKLNVFSFRTVLKKASGQPHLDRQESAAAPTRDENMDYLDYPWWSMIIQISLCGLKQVLIFTPCFLGKPFALILVVSLWGTLPSTCRLGTEDSWRFCFKHIPACVFGRIRNALDSYIYGDHGVVASRGQSCLHEIRCDCFSRETGWTASTWKRATKGQPLELRTTAGETKDLQPLYFEKWKWNCPILSKNTFMVWKLLLFASLCLGSYTTNIICIYMYIWSLPSGRLWPALELSRMVLQHLLWCAAFR